MLQMTKEKLKSYDPSNISDLWELAKPELEYRMKLHQRVMRKHKVTDLMGTDGGKKTITPFEYEIKSIGQGYLGGKEPIYTVRTSVGDTPEDIENAKEYKQALDDICRYNDCQATHLDLVGSFLETSAAYLYIYQDNDKNIVHAQLDSLQTVGIWDYSTPSNLIGVVRGWEEIGKDNTSYQAIELITDETIRKFTDQSGDYKMDVDDQIFWGDVPVVAFEKPGTTAIFEPAITLIDAYEQILNNINSMTQYNDDAKLKLVGYSPESEAGTPERIKEEERILKSHCIYVGEGGDVDWLLKNIDYSGMLDVLKSLHTLIMFCVASPDTTDTTFSTSESSLALRLKMFPFELKAADTKAIFKKGYLRQIEIETRRINLNRKRSFDFTKVDVEIPVNIPSDTQKSVEMAAAMKNSGLFSDKTCIAKSGIDIDPDQEIIQRDLEAENDYNQVLNRSNQVETIVTEREEIK